MNFTILHLVRKDKQNRGEKPKRRILWQNPKPNKQNAAAHVIVTKPKPSKTRNLVRKRVAVR